MRGDYRNLLRSAAGLIDRADAEIAAPARGWRIRRPSSSPSPSAAPLRHRDRQRPPTSGGHPRITEATHVRRNPAAPAALPTHAGGRPLSGPFRPHPRKAPHLWHRTAVFQARRPRRLSPRRPAGLGRTRRQGVDLRSRARPGASRQAPSHPLAGLSPARRAAEAARQLRPCPRATAPDRNASSSSCSARSPAISRPATRRTSWPIRSSASPSPTGRRRSIFAPATSRSASRRSPNTAWRPSGTPMF